MKKITILLLLISLNGFSQIKVDTSFNGFKTEYYNNGNPKKKVEYKKGNPCGLVITYREKGGLSEVGTFCNKRWIGEYKFYYDNGQVQQNFNFDSNGKRVGYQKTYYENGLMQTITAAYDNDKDAYSLEFDTLGNIVGTLGLRIDGYVIYKDDKRYDNYKGMQEVLLELVKKENEATLRLKNK
jgi:antitoxin component YwqK of YwqJK toxin-antitoxin module